MLKQIPHCNSTPSAFEGSVFVKYFTTAQFWANRVVILSKGAFDTNLFLDEYFNSDVFHFFLVKKTSREVQFLLRKLSSMF